MLRILALGVFLSSCTRAYGSPAPIDTEAGARVTAQPDAGSRVADTDAGAAYMGPRSPLLGDAKLHSPIPGGTLGGWDGDTGLDIAGDRLEVFAIAAGTLDYSEHGHTLWTRGRDTAFSVRLALDEPIPWGEHRVTHVYYTHLSRLETVQAEGASPRKHVEGGERIAVSGIGNGVPHLHLGLLLDGEVEQDS